MKRFTSLSLNILLICSAGAQPIRDTGKPPVALKPWTPDRNIVMDFFQDQQFAEAIDYLQPAFTADSNNINILSWLGYASYMNEDKPASERYNTRIFQLDSNGSYVKVGRWLAGNDLQLNLGHIRRRLQVRFALT